MGVLLRRVGVRGGAGRSGVLVIGWVGGSVVRLVRVRGRRGGGCGIRRRGRTGRPSSVRRGRGGRGRSSGSLRVCGRIRAGGGLVPARGAGGGRDRDSGGAGEGGGVGRQ